MLRCKLKCTRANGRITENSHYHCCLCGRVLIRKVHLYCHLQAHSFGTTEDVDEDAMDDGKDEEPEDEGDMDDDDAGNSTLDTSQVSGITSSQPENVVALTDGTQVICVQAKVVKPQQPIKGKLLLSIYGQICVVQYGEFVR